ncbi:hypothetical protein [Halomicronema sp. CCY15110]|nr:hypothetical protein [Halomicronema sp. CCY15110]
MPALTILPLFDHHFRANRAALLRGYSSLSASGMKDDWAGDLVVYS